MKSSKEIKKKEEKKIEQVENLTLWQKIKNPFLTLVFAIVEWLIKSISCLALIHIEFLTWVLGLMILIPRDAKAVGFARVRAPPYYAQEIIEKDYKLGWKYILKDEEEWHKKGSQPWIWSDAAIVYFKKAHAKDKKPESLYLWAYAVYERLQAEPGFELTEKMAEEELLPLLDKRLKEEPNDLDFIDLKQIILYNLAIMYAEIPLGEAGPYSHHVDPSKMDFYKEKAEYYAEEHAKFVDSIDWDKIKIILFPEVTYTEKEIKDIKENFKNGFEKRKQTIKQMLEKIKER